jgi:AcrR family transcriptional regulator
LKARRADAARNQASILRAVRTLVSTRGPDVGMDEIAREAGVAVGTLYRHFPTKTDLVNAILTDHVSSIVEDLEAATARVEEGGRALPELTALLERVAASVGQDRAVKAAATNLASDAMRDLEQRAMAALTRLVAAAHREGALYPDVSPADLALLVSMLPGDDVPEPARRRWLQVALRGLTPPSGGFLPPLGHTR